MTLEALTSIDIPNFFIYDTLPSAPHHYPEPSGRPVSFENDGLSSSSFVGNTDGSSSTMLGSFPALEPVNPALQGSLTMRRKKRQRRPRICKNTEEAENQRMTHIAVERNRRRQMNEHLAVLRSLMPESYIQRGDQASVVGGAIDFVKELEQLLQSLEAQKRTLQQQRRKNEGSVLLSSMSISRSTNNKNNDSKDEKNCPPFAQFFTYPQYMWCHGPRDYPSDGNLTAAAAADIEVTLVETHANLRILSPERPGQLMKMVEGFQSLHLTILHLNVTTLDPMVLYSFSTKVEEECKLTSVEDIAAAVHHMLSLIEAEAALADLREGHE